MAQAIMVPRRGSPLRKRIEAFQRGYPGTLRLPAGAVCRAQQHVEGQEHGKFAEEFVTTMKVLKKFMEVSEKHTPYLLRKAQRIEQYLDQH